MSSRAQCRDCKVPQDKREGYCTTTIDLKGVNWADAAEAVKRYLKRPRPPVDPALCEPLPLGGPCPKRK